MFLIDPVPAHCLLVAFTRQMLEFIMVRESIKVIRPLVLRKIIKVFIIYGIIIKSLYPLRAKKTFIRKKLGHTAVSAFKASSVTL